MSTPDAAAAAILEQLPASLTIHPQQIDLLRDAVMLIQVPLAAFAEASFLDRRLIGRETPAGWFSWEQLAARMTNRPAESAAHYIFHVGHCGSTLVSRLLGDVGVLPLREPLPLRTLAEIQSELGAPECRWNETTFTQRLSLLASLFDRGEGARAVKATSFCNDLAAPLLDAAPERRATIVYSPLRAYLANVLVGPNSRLDLLSAAPMRIRRLAARIGEPAGRLSQMSQGVLSAMSWATETSALAAVVDGYGGRVLRIDFDQWLADVMAGLRSLADHVVAGVPDDRIAAAISGPSLRQYSKAPEHAYDADLRRRVLEDGERQFGDEIRAGIAWCERVAREAPEVARALDLFDTAHGR
ncbi:MAG TPA: hypothetical protein VLT59_03370 [Steroidobacteraceae bacterium]|nr:hypothetical protein [Steroidobacteraceae bacterium]